MILERVVVNTLYERWLICAELCCLADWQFLRELLSAVHHTVQKWRFRWEDYIASGVVSCPHLSTDSVEGSSCNVTIDTGGQVILRGALTDNAEQLIDALRKILNLKESWSVIFVQYT